MEKGLILPKTHSSLKLRCGRFIYMEALVCTPGHGIGSKCESNELEKAIWFKGNAVVYWSLKKKKKMLAEMVS